MRKEARIARMAVFTIMKETECLNKDLCRLVVGKGMGVGWVAKKSMETEYDQGDRKSVV